MIFLLDTDSYTHLTYNQANVIEKARLAASQGHVVGTTIITVVEVLQGRGDALLKADTRARFLAAQERFLKAQSAFQALLVAPLDDAALTQLERWQGMKGIRNVGRADLLIACVVLALGATLVTRNLKHFRLIPGLRLENWVD